MLPKTLNEDIAFRRGIDREEGDLLKEAVLVLACARNNKFVLCREKVVKSKVLTLIKEEDGSFMRILS